MIFRITATETVQLHPADFHSQYEDALIKILYQRLYNKISYKYGKVLAIRRIPDQKIAPPLLLTHYGIAAFKIRFEAIVERIVKYEAAYGILREIYPLDKEHVCLHFQVGSSIYRMVVNLCFYTLEQNQLVCNDEAFRGVYRLEIGYIYQGIQRYDEDFCVIGVKTDDDVDEDSGDDAENTASDGVYSTNDDV